MIHDTPRLRDLTVACYAIACVCDATVALGDLSDWLLSIGVVAAMLTALVALTNLVREPRLPDDAMPAAGWGLALLIEFCNLHMRQTLGPEAIGVNGLMLSLAAVAVLLATASSEREHPYR